MRNLDQVRARNAHQAIEAGLRGRGVEDGNALSGFPALIVNNGLLSTLSFSISRKDQGGYREICDAIAGHLADPLINLLRKKPATLLGLRDFLVDEDSSTLRLCTAEALAFLNYLRRFAAGEAKRREDDES